MLLGTMPLSSLYRMHGNMSSSNLLAKLANRTCWLLIWAQEEVVARLKETQMLVERFSQVRPTGAEATVC